MKLIPFKTQPGDLPLKIVFSLEKQIEGYKTYAKDKDHPYQKSAKVVLDAIKDYPQLWEGIEDYSELGKYEEQIKMLLNPLFPDMLQTNEIKSVMVPFSFNIFNPTQRFQKILDNAGEDFVFDMGFDSANSYFFACSFILGTYYNTVAKVSRPIYVDIPDKKSGTIRHYRAMFNADFMDVTKADSTPELTPEEIKELLVNDDVEFWKSKFPEGSYTVKGFGLMTLYDATNDIILSKIRSIFLRNGNNVFKEFQSLLGDLMGIKDLLLGNSIYDPQTEQSLGGFLNSGSQSIILKEHEKLDYKTMFCDYVCANALRNSEIIAIADVEAYGKKSGGNLFYEKLHSKGIKSIILAPIKLDNGYVQLLELASKRPNELNSVNATKLEDVIPFVKVASERNFEESENIIDSTIQENYTSIHPTVKWRFTEAASQYNTKKIEGVENPTLEDIIFNNVYPLYAQSDIKGSSTARNEAIQADLETQLSSVIQTFQKIMKVQSMPIYDKLIYRVKGYLKGVEQGLKAGDEVSILEFLKKDVYPVFKHLKTVNPVFEKAIKDYMSKIDPNLHVVYDQRKSYEDSVTVLNDRLAAHLDKMQEEAQEMFPHFYERYKTDGVEFNMYIGDDLTNTATFDVMYLHNLRLWQLKTICELEQVAFDLQKELTYPLRVASLVLIHSNPLAIRFSMEQKNFNVDGAYNARYEIVKKRIDKSHIKGTDERLTQPGKIAIVYSQNRDAQEYINYLEYLQSEKMIGEIEMLDLEDLQGVSGLKALRAEVLYKTDSQNKKGSGGKKSSIAVNKKGQVVEVK